MEQLLKWDIGLFKLINQGNSNAFFDFLMPLITDKYTWIPLYLIILIWFIYKFRKYAFLPIIGLALTVGISDYLTSGIIKPQVNRARPCMVESNEAITFMNCRTSPSFPSSHASNHFAIAIFLLYFIPCSNKWLRFTLILWALAIAYSRVYVGVHYPSDVLGGAAIGVLLGMVFGLSTKKSIIKYAK